MDGTSNAKPKVFTADYTLVLSRLEQLILKGENRAACLKHLARADIWQNIQTEAQVKWARLAQMAGDTATALKVLSHINRAHPQFQRAWSDRLELASFVGSQEDIAGILAEARGTAGQDVYETLGRFAKEKPDGAAMDEDVKAASAPFEGYRRRRDSLDLYLHLFSGREDCFARQWVNKQESTQGYVPVRRPIEAAHVEEHLQGRKTYGMYLLDSNSRVRTAVIDIDLVQEFRKTGLKADDKKLIRREGIYLLQRVRELALEAGLSPLLEYSGGKGFHFWFFFSRSEEASKAKNTLFSIVRPIAGDLHAFQMEIFPKQDQLKGKGLGNLVKLPLGIHRLTGKRSYFKDCHDRSVEGQMEFLKQVRAVSLDEVKSAPGCEKKILFHPRWQKWSEEYPSLARLESLCTPLAQIIAVCREGRGLAMREEKVLYQTIGFLPEAKKLMHHLMAFEPDYNPHLVDFRLSRLRGRPLGCKRIHSLLNFSGEPCPFEGQGEYAHPLLHLDSGKELLSPRAEKVENLTSALDNLKLAISQVERFVH